MALNQTFSGLTQGWLNPTCLWLISGSPVGVQPACHSPHAPPTPPSPQPDPQRRSRAFTLFRPRQKNANSQNSKAPKFPAPERSVWESLLCGAPSCCTPSFLEAVLETVPPPYRKGIPPSRGAESTKQP